jgi:hypothetical protein
MCAADRPLRGALAAAYLSLVGCAATAPAPAAWHVNHQEVARRPYGAWANVGLVGGAGVSGELLGVDGEAVFVGLAPRMYRLPARCVTSLRLVAFDAPSAVPATVGTAGVVSTLSHGLFLVFTAPAWLAVTLVVSSNAGNAGYPEIPGRAVLEEARPWARFPQGLPAGYVQRVPERETLDAQCRPLPLGAPAALPAAPEGTP